MPESDPTRGRPPSPDAAAAPLPGTLGEAVRAEWAAVLRPPYHALATVSFNAAVMSAAWFLLPPHWNSALFSLHGSLAYALVLAAWMYADVPATNVLGPDRQRMMAALDDPVMLRRLLLAKNIVLWSLVTPLCTAIAVVTGVLTHHGLATFYSVVIIAVIPFGTLGISACVGIAYPYHPMPLRDRWGHRRPWLRMGGRWAVLVTLPYLLVPIISVTLMTPSLVVWGIAAPRRLSARVPAHHLGAGIAVACLVATLCSIGGRRVGARMARDRRAALVAFLADPTSA
ncbi:MAG TPA: hypothetical protein VND70_05355 [Acidimicrobiales bacterium]|nr:hypothetical protein [Acidimicrobiales bacterium]